jgi:3-hydroxyacyl-[acyl-carrier-protein] dehydratase
MLDKNEILARIPHREPFLWLDCVESLEPGVRCVALKRLDPDEPVFAGHFPGRPLMPGVLLIEAVAQTSCVMMFQPGEPGGDGGTPLLAAVNRFKFLRPVGPGVELRIRTRVLTALGRMTLVEGSVEVDGEVVALGELSVVGP